MLVTDSVTPPKRWASSCTSVAVVVINGQDGRFRFGLVIGRALRESFLLAHTTIAE
jgi:hypothetical protein